MTNDGGNSGGPSQPDGGTSGGAGDSEAGVDHRPGHAEVPLPLTAGTRNIKQALWKPGRFFPRECGSKPPSAPTVAGRVGGRSRNI